jgi:hypothetical protein
VKRGGEYSGSALTSGRQETMRLAESVVAHASSLEDKKGLA